MFNIAFDAPNNKSTQATAASNLKSLLIAARKSGSVDLSNRSLDKVPQELWKFEEISVPDAKWWDLPGLVRLSLQSNLIAELNPGTSSVEFRELKSLDVSHNKISQITTLFDSPLESLNASHNEIVAIGPCLSECTTLKELIINNNKLVTLPPLNRLSLLSELRATQNSLSALQSLPLTLMKLDMSYNKFAELPVALKEMSLLRELDLSSNLLKDLSPAFLSLKNLVRLDLKLNKLTELRFLSALKSLRELFAANNEIQSISDDLVSLEGLVTLDLSDNRIVDLDSRITRMTALQRADFSRNLLTKIAPEIGLLNLISLKIESNPLKSIRSDLLHKGTPALLSFLKSRIPAATIAQTEQKLSQKSVNADLPFLGTKKLDLSSQKLTSIPPDTFQMTALSSLKLNKNSLCEIPSEVSNLILLETLEAAWNSLSSLPPQLSRCSLLKSLRLEHNNFGALPPVLGELVHLQELDVSVNKISSLDLSTIPNLRSLLSLRVTNNQITAIPEALFSLISLSDLDLTDNKIDSLPIGITKLQLLTNLNLTNNDLTTVPPELGNMTLLRNLALEGNRLRSIKQTVLQKGTPALLQYLRDKIPK